MLSRDWKCHNRKCGVVFHSYDHANPPCPTCGCVRVGWVPGGGHIASVAPKADATLRAISDQHGGMNLNSASPSRLNRAAPRVESPPLSPELGVRHWGMGICSQVSAHGPVCVPASNPMSIAGKVIVGNNAAPREHSGTVPGPSANAIVVARSTQRTIT